MVQSKEEAKLDRRLQKRKGNVLFIENPPEGMKEWLAKRGEKNGRSMAKEAVEILESKRRADEKRAAA